MCALSKSLILKAKDNVDKLGEFSYDKVSIKKPKKVFMIHDFRVYVYLILPMYSSIIEQVDKKQAKSWCRAAWGWILLRGFTGVPYQPFIPIVVDDEPEYWKRVYLKEKMGPDFPVYKAGRREKTQDWYEVESIGKDVIYSLNVNLVSRSGYEADDIASGLVRTLGTNLDYLIMLSTNDTDWMGMIRPNVLWCNMIRYTPRLRTPGNYQEWVQKKNFSVEVYQPSDIWKAKSIDGDKSDNLPPGSPIEVIDLLKPPSEYDLVTSKGFLQQVSILENLEPEDYTGKIIKAQDYIRNNGFTLPFTDHALYPVSKEETPYNPVL